MAKAGCRCPLRWAKSRTRRWYRQSYAGCRCPPEPMGKRWPPRRKIHRHTHLQALKAVLYTRLNAFLRTGPNISPTFN